MSTALIVYLIGVAISALLGVCFLKFICYDKNHEDIDVGDIACFTVLVLFTYFGALIWSCFFLSEFSKHVVIKNKTSKKEFY